MHARLIPLLGAAAGVVLGALMVVGVLVDQPVLTVCAAALLGAAILAVQTDTWRRTRSMRNYLRDEIREVRAAQLASSPTEQEEPDEGSSAVSAQDLLGAVRVLQAQYTGRLDRMQRTLDDALLALPTRHPDADDR